ncbi:MAG: hypothetical protein RL637_1305 [Pseudomonadota bacterium]
MQQDNPSVRLLSYRELILTLQRLCKEKRTGTMFINDGSESSAKIVLEQGTIFDVTFKGQTGEAALALVKEIKQGKASFSSRLGESANLEAKISLSTVDIFKFLISNIPTQPAAPVAPQPVEKVEPIFVPKSDTLPYLPEIATDQKMIAIEAQLAVILGPVARIVYLDYAKDIQAAMDFKALDSVIERLSKQVLSGEQQKIFRQSVVAFVSQHNLKGQEAILTAFKGIEKKIRLNLSSLALCVAKHAEQGDLGVPLFGRLVTQVEYAGNLGSSVALLDLLRLLEKSGKTGLLEAREKEKIGGFYFDKGVLFNAVEFGMNGKLIALDILQWDHDYLVFRAVPQEGVTRQINQTVDVLAKEVEKFRETASTKAGPIQYSKADEITLTANAVQLAESCDPSCAEQLLVQVLMSNEDNFKGWLWLSRVLTNMTAIEIALKKAAFINPRSTDLAEDIKKFSLARKIITEDFVLRCPFCWMPLEEHHIECSYCRSNFFITPDFFKTVGKAKVDILDKAIERYSHVLQQELEPNNTIYLRFYLAMAYLNRKYYQEGLDQLTEIVKLAPENNALYIQNRLLIDYMNTIGLTVAVIQPPHASVHIGHSSTDKRKSKILVVEDSMVTRKVIARTLMANGYEVFEAKNAHEALMDIEERKPDLALLDIILPGKDGYEILAEIRKKPMFEKLPAIMLTSRDSLFDKLKGKVSEANEYLTKPFQPDELLAIVRKYLK